MGRGYFARTHKYEDRTGGRGRLRKPLPPHGTRNRYRSRVDPCKCRACTDANTAYTTMMKKLQQQREGRPYVTRSRYWE